MAQYIDSVPLSGIIRIRDTMYSVKDPFRLDQGDVSFDAPDTVKEAMRRAIDENRSHYVQTTGVPRLLELVRAHQSTLIFVNSRRIAERLAAALNELAGEVLVRSHHGSLARPQRIDVEDRLKAGQIPPL